MIGRPTKITPEILTKIQDLYRSGKYPREIARILPVSHTTVYKAAQKLSALDHLKHIENRPKPKY